MLKPFQKSVFHAASQEARFLRVVHLFGSKEDYRLVDIPFSAIMHIASGTYGGRSAVYLRIDQKACGLSLRDSERKETEYLVLPVSIDQFHAQSAKADPVTGVVDFSRIERNKDFWEKHEALLAKTASAQQNQGDPEEKEGASETKEHQERQAHYVHHEKLEIK
jgi:hypothetical protein